MPGAAASRLCLLRCARAVALEATRRESDGKRNHLLAAGDICLIRVIIVCRAPCPQSDAISLSWLVRRQREISGALA